MCIYVYLLRLIPVFYFEALYAQIDTLKQITAWNAFLGPKNRNLLEKKSPPPMQPLRQQRKNCLISTQFLSRSFKP